MPEDSKISKDLKRSLELLSKYLDLFKKGEYIFYLPMAVELRKLLCDKNALLPAAIPEFILHKLHSTEIFEKSPSLLNGLMHFMPGRLETDQNGFKNFGLSFSSTQESMTTNQWIEQIFFKEGITIRELIKSVADKEAVHADAEYNGTLQYVNNWQYSNIESHIVGIYGISRYIYDLCMIEYKKYC